MSERLEVAISSAFARDFPGVNKAQLRDSLLTGEWIIPRSDSDFWLPWMGTTGHKAMPTAIKLKEQEVGIFAKPFVGGVEQELAIREFYNSETAFRRGINLPRMVALMKDEDFSLLICMLDRTVEPFSSKDLTFKITDSRVYQPLDFLNQVVGSISEMHNQGIIHGDLHLGNCGHQFHSENPPRIIFFDFETSTVLSDDDLMCKKQQDIKSNAQRMRLKRFEAETPDDLAIFLANLRFYNFPLNERVLLEVGSKVYIDARQSSYGLMDGEQFQQQTETAYRNFMKNLHLHNGEK